MYENLRVALGTVAQRRQFFVWRLYGRRPDGKFEKEPLGRIDHTSPANWLTFDEAVARCVDAPAGEVYAPGLYLSADLGVFLLDIDHLPEPHKLDADANAILARFPGAMAEWSSSERGLHIIGRHDPSRTGGHKCKAGNIELYTRDRGVVLSANAVGSADTDLTDALRQLIAERFAPTANMTVAGGVPADPMLATSAMHAWLRKVEAAEPGTRNSVLNDAAFTLGGHVATGALDEGVVRRVLVKATTGWDNPDKVLRTINSSLRKGKDSPITVPVPLPAPIPRISAPGRLRPVVRSAAELLRRDFKPVQWALRGILPEGVTILSGDPKVGKSWLVYQACVAIATGKPLWPGSQPEIQGDALMLALEDNDRRLRRRLDKLQFFTGRDDVSRLHYATEWPRAEAGVEEIARWLREHPQARIVVIDTISAFRDPEPNRNKSAYANDYSVGEMLKPLAKEFSVAIVIVMHNRKQSADDVMQKVSGTQGMTGSVDNVLVLERGRGDMDGALHVDGRDIEEPRQLGLRHENGLWRLLGDVEDIQRSRGRQMVLQALESVGNAASAKQIHEAMDGTQKFSAVKMMLSRMVKDGEIQNLAGTYVPRARSPVTSVTALPALSTQ